MLLLRAALPLGLLGQAAPPTEATPEMVERVLKPSITFALTPAAAAGDEAAAEPVEKVADWRRLARTVAQLQQLDCAEDAETCVHAASAARCGLLFEGSTGGFWFPR